MRARALAFAVIAALCSAAGFAPKVFAQQADEPLVATASEWGGQGGVYTCAQWRAYVTRMYRLGDPRHRGYIEAKDFEIIKKASPVFQMATFDYFDMAGKGRVTQKEFIEFESPFFARFDKRHTCRVTSEDIRAANTPTQTQTRAAAARRTDGGGTAADRRLDRRRRLRLAVASGEAQESSNISVFRICCRGPRIRRQPIGVTMSASSDLLQFAKERRFATILEPGRSCVS